MTVNNYPVKSLYLNNYRGQLGLSMKEETPFEGTIRENITFGNKSISDKDILEAFERVGLTSFLRRQPNGLQTILYPEGKQMSYTIAKKIVLARAIVKKPKILILEDALDQFNENETNRIIDFLTDASHPWAVVVVSSNPRWVNSCDEIITLEKGTVKDLQIC